MGLPPPQANLSRGKCRANGRWKDSGAQEAVDEGAPDRPSPVDTVGGLAIDEWSPSDTVDGSEPDVACTPNATESCDDSGIPCGQPTPTGASIIAVVVSGANSAF